MAKVLATHDDGVLCGYDIGCTADVTVKNSSLGPEFIRKKAKFCVNAFHGWAHKRECQLHNHPIFLKGLGIEDLEVCERIFSSLNAVAHAVRHASHFHYIQFITLHLDSLRRDKYGALSKPLYVHHRL